MIKERKVVQKDSIFTVFDGIYNPGTYMTPPKISTGKIKKEIVEWYVEND